MADILPCPNPKCRDESPNIASNTSQSRWWVWCSLCQYHAPRGDDPAEAIALHNGIAREEEWRRVDDELPAPVSGDLFDVRLYDPDLFSDGGGHYFGIARRTEGLWAMVWPHPGQCIKDVEGFVTDWRPHTPPNPPEES